MQAIWGNRNVPYPQTGPLKLPCSLADVLTLHAQAQAQPRGGQARLAPNRPGTIPSLPPLQSITLFFGMHQAVTFPTLYHNHNHHPRLITPHLVTCSGSSSSSSYSNRALVGHVITATIRANPSQGTNSQPCLLQGPRQSNWADQHLRRLPALGLLVHSQAAMVYATCH